MRRYAVELLAEIGDVPPQVSARGTDGWLHGAFLRPASERPGTDADHPGSLRSTGERVCHGSIVSRRVDCLSVVGEYDEFVYSGRYGEFDSLMHNTNRARRPLIREQDVITMKKFPLDSNRMRMISTGVQAKPVPVWVVLADGSRRPDPQGRQEIDGNGCGIWLMEAIVPADEGDERDKTTTVEVQVASQDRPNSGQLGDLLTFEGLTVSPGYINRKTGALTTPRWSADGVRGGGMVKPSPAHKDAA